MRSILLLSVTLAACFSEPPLSQQCVRGTAGCDCADGTCEANLECVESIDKCVPIDCTPGERTCVCAEGECADGLACRGGVCLEENADATGSTPMSGGVASTTVEPTSAGTTSASTSIDESDTSVSESNASSTGVGTSASTTMPATSTGTEPVDCWGCITLAAQGPCADEYAECKAPSSDCDDIYDCLFAGTTDSGNCCSLYPGGAQDWNTLIDCAAAMECMGQCAWQCM